MALPHGEERWAGTGEIPVFVELFRACFPWIPPAPGPAKPFHGIMERVQAGQSRNLSEQIHVVGKCLRIPLEPSAFRDTELPHHTPAWSFGEAPL